MGLLDDLGLHTSIWTMPVEIDGGDPLRPGSRARRRTTRWRSRRSGGHSCGRTTCSASSVVASSASPARCTCSGARSTWRSRRFSGRPAPLHPRWRTELRAPGDARGLLAGGQQRRLLARWRRRAGSSTPTPIPSRDGLSRTHRRCPPRRAYDDGAGRVRRCPTRRCASADDPEALLLERPAVDLRGRGRHRRSCGPLGPRAIEPELVAIVRHGGRTVPGASSEVAGQARGVSSGGRRRRRR